MITDNLLRFSNAQAVTAAAASTNYIDLEVAREIAVGHPLWIQVNVEVAMTDGSSDSTLSVDAYYDSTTTFTPDASQLGLIIPAVSAIGWIGYFALKPHLSTTYRYLELYYTPNNGNLSTGTISASLVLDIDRNTHEANGFTIST